MNGFRSTSCLRKFHRRAVRFLTAGFMLTLCACGSREISTGRDGIVAVGAGSYTTRLPAGCKPPPEKIHRAAALAGPVPTNDWWSSIVWQPHSQPLFAHPLALRCGPRGLAVGYPGSSIHTGKDAFIGGGIGETGDFTLGLGGIDGFCEAVLLDSSDWFVGVRFEQDQARLDARFGHGSPFVYVRHGEVMPELRFAEKPRLWHGKEGDAVVGLTVRGHHYGLFGPSGARWSAENDTTWSLESGKDYFSIALLPAAEDGTIRGFSEVAHHHVTDTRVVPEVHDGFVITDYRFTVEALEGSGSDTLFALYPHQWKYSEDKMTTWSYASVRGTMKLGRGSGFRTRLPVQGVLPMLPADGIRDRDRLIGYLREELPGPVRDFKDTYWEGKLLGKLATLAGIAESLGETALRDRFHDAIKARLENWFTATPGENETLFYHDARWGALIGSKPSYDSDSRMNDHHFHYGYFIRAAAEVARVDLEWTGKWGPMVELLIRDIASSDPNDPMFPRFRCFDPYAGHSWASGDADYGDGNNQESASEAMNAWNGIMLWGAATGRDDLLETGIYLFNTERTAIEEYWFDVNRTNFPKEFPHKALGMIWGGKGAYGTWFSGEIDHIYGINWLPFTPASVYLGRHPEYVGDTHGHIVRHREAKGDYNTGWGDLLAMFGALHDPRAPIEHLDKNPGCRTEAGNSRAFMYQWIHTLGSLGLNTSGVTADHPFVNIYEKNGRRFYAAYHFGEEPVEVTFSDGHTLMARPGQLTTSR